MYVDLEVVDMIEELEYIIQNASNIPFSHRKSIDKDEVLDLIKSIKASLPDELKQASWVTKERNKIMGEAKEEAEKLIHQAKLESERLKEEYEQSMERITKNSEQIVEQYIESSEPMLKAKERADLTIQRAEKIAKEIKQGSIIYAEDVLISVEEHLKSILNEIERNRMELSE